MLNWVDKIKWFVVLVLVQGIIIGQMEASRIAVPLIYIYYLLKLPSYTGRKQLLFHAFFLGLCIDMFGNTPGLNITASIWLAMARPQLLRWQTARDASESFSPGIRTMRFGPFFRYIFPAVLLHSFILNMVDAFSLVRIEQILLNTLADTVATVVLILIIELVRRNN